MSDIRGQTASGVPTDVLVDKAGRLIVQANLTGANQSGDSVRLLSSVNGVLLTGPEVWTLYDSQQVTVSTTALTISSLYTRDLTDDMEALVFQLEAGGPLRVNSSGRTVTAGGTEGSAKVISGDTWVVRGLSNIRRHQAIVATGGSDGTVNTWVYIRATA